MSLIEQRLVARACVGVEDAQGRDLHQQTDQLDTDTCCLVRGFDLVDESMDTLLAQNKNMVPGQWP
jgi:hypothetical protein